MPSARQTNNQHQTCLIRNWRYDDKHRTLHGQLKFCALNLQHPTEHKGCIPPDSSRIFRRLKKVHKTIRAMGAQALRPPDNRRIFRRPGSVHPSFPRCGSAGSAPIGRKGKIPPDNSRIFLRLSLVQQNHPRIGAAGSAEKIGRDFSKYFIE